MKRLPALLAFAAAALGLLPLPGAAHADEIRIATQPVPHYAPIFVAKKKHWLDEELATAGAPEIKWASFAAGPPINESFAAGQQDIGFLGDTPALIGRAAGIDTRVIGITSTGAKTLAVVVAADSPIKTPADLKGKKVAVTKGSYAHHLLALVLQQGGLGLGDIEQINLPNGEVATTLIKGDIDAGAVWEPVLTKFRNQGAIRVLADGTGIKTGLLVIIAAEDFIKDKPEQVKALLRAYQRGADYIRSNPKEAAELISADTNLAPDLLTQVFANFDYAPPITEGVIQDIKKSEAFIRSVGLIRTAVDVDGFVVRGLGPAVAAPTAAGR
jgi:sulfonate transport system substrate-binding protein